MMATYLKLLRVPALGVASDRASLKVSAVWDGCRVLLIQDALFLNHGTLNFSYFVAFKISTFIHLDRNSIFSLAYKVLCFSRLSCTSVLAYLILSCSLFPLCIPS